ncbi:hypothetical protein V6N13_045093 [Hibiscus sabdariffa]|uniref:Uncharacterized protein n=1 Tax=Hibiscus sabdariffa TaxID=183260 RepID=A0ABR2RK28_9ROSI
MDDFPGLLAKDFGIKPQGKSAPMAPPKSSSSGSSYGFGSGFTRSSYGNAKSTSNSIFDDQDRDGFLFNDAYGGQRKYSSESRATSAQTSSFDYDSFFEDTKPPVFDKQVYDDDLFDGLSEIQSSSAKSGAKFEDVFEVSGSPRKHKSMNSLPFDDLLGNLGRKETEVKANSERVRAEKDAPLFDDFLAGFDQSSSAASARSTSEAGHSQRPASNSSKTASNLMEDPFVVFEATHDPADSSTGLLTDPSEVTSKLNGFGKSKVENSSGTGGIFDDIDPLDGLGKSVPPVSSKINKRGKDGSPLRTVSGPQAPATKEQNDRDHENGTKQRIPSMDGFLDSNQPVFDMPSMSTDFHSSVGRSTSPHPYLNVGSNGTSSQVHTTPRSEENFDVSDDVWLTVSEVPLFTQPTSAPPPSRPPPSRQPRVPKTTPGSFSSTNAKKKVDDFSTFQNSTQDSQSSQSARAVASSSVTSQIDELEDFAMGRAWNNVDQAEAFPGDGFETNSAAAASAAAMKEAMDRAEAKFRHAKEMRERENLKAARTKEAGQMDKDERATQDALDREVREKKERLEHERQQREREEEEREKRRREMEREREEKEREQRRLEKERERVREMEREKARQAVERATREARERAAAEARARAERASVKKATEARERAERAAVQRAQAEARERAAAEAKERAERAAAEAREREEREREARERTAAAKAEAEAKHRAERAAVERAAAEARERAAASARASQQYNDNDFESFFSMSSRPSSAPKPRANASDPVFDGQNKGGPEVTRRMSVGSSSSMKKASSTANIVDDLSSIFGAATSSSGEFQEVEGETEERRRARLERHQRTQERAAKALAEKNQRDLQVQREQAERHRIAETLDVEIRRWSAGKEGNLRALLSTLQYVLWPECGWQPVSLTDLITAAAVKKAYRKATLCIHPDKVQQKGANLQQKYVSEKVFDLLKEAWTKFNSEELF